MAIATPMTADEFGRTAGVSRETMERLAAYEALLRQWQPRINLVSNDSLTDVWRRHFLDSVQLSRWLKKDTRAVDMGSGAGFPGMVLSIVSGAPVMLAESDIRKCTFLREVRRVTDASAEVRQGRLEDFSEGDVELVIARALAPVGKLLDYAVPLLGEKGLCVFLKGARADHEIEEAGARWHMQVQQYPSAADPRGVILEIRNPERV